MNESSDKKSLSFMKFKQDMKAQTKYMPEF